jgi:hypothetical protein
MMLSSKWPYKPLKVRIIKCECGKCKKGSNALSWYCNHIGEVYLVDDYEHSPKDFYHIIGQPMRPNDGCWIVKKDTEIVWIDEEISQSLFEI